MEIKINNAGSLEMFGPNGKPWRTAEDAYLDEAITLAKSDASAGMKLALELVSKAGVTGVVRFRCAVPAQIDNSRELEGAPA